MMAKIMEVSFTKPELSFKMHILEIVRGFCWMIMNWFQITPVTFKNLGCCPFVTMLIVCSVSSKDVMVVAKLLSY